VEYQFHGQCVKINGQARSKMGWLVKLAGFLHVASNEPARDYPRRKSSLMLGDDSIDVDRLLADLPLVGVEYHESLDSTQDRAAELAASGGRGPVLVVADRQTAGRGRGANRWWTGSGSLAFSLLLDPRQWQLAAEAVPARSLAAGVAVVAAVAPALYPHNVGLRWPNDVYVGSRKLSGILIDVLADGRHIVGIGLNVNNSFDGAPAEVRDRGTSMFDLTGRRHDRTTVLAGVIDELAQVLARLGTDPTSVGEQFQDLCVQTGQMLRVAVGDRIREGRCLGIAPNGALLLETESGIQQLYSGVIQNG
jgi:BirA family transcriptional regulator, biotin operon repressor / biotin---[acetyl-CoA-carboxylase] ligase